MYPLEQFHPNHFPPGLSPVQRNLNFQIPNYLTFSRREFTLPRSDWPATYNWIYSVTMQCWHKPVFRYFTSFPRLRRLNRNSNDVMKSSHCGSSSKTNHRNIFSSLKSFDHLSRYSMQFLWTCINISSEAVPQYILHLYRERIFWENFSNSCWRTFSRTQIVWIKLLSETFIFPFDINEYTNHR